MLKIHQGVLFFFSSLSKAFKHELYPELQQGASPLHGQFPTPQLSLLQEPFHAELLPEQARGAPGEGFSTKEQLPLPGVFGAALSQPMDEAGWGCRSPGEPPNSH